MLRRRVGLHHHFIDVSPRHVDDIRDHTPAPAQAGVPCRQDSPTKISIKASRASTVLSACPPSLHSPHSTDTSHLLRTQRPHRTVRNSSGWLVSTCTNTTNHQHQHQRNAPRHILLLARPVTRRRPAMERAAPVPRPDPHAGRRRWVELPRDGQHQGHVRRHRAHRPAVRTARRRGWRWWWTAVRAGQGGGGGREHSDRGLQ